MQKLKLGLLKTAEEKTADEKTSSPTSLGISQSLSSSPLSPDRGDKGN